MNKIDVVKTIAGIVSGIGSGVVINNIIKATTPSNLGTFSKIGVAIGGFILSSIISDKASQYAEELVDTTVNSIKESSKLMSAVSENN